MRVEIVIEQDNDLFGGNNGAELARILQKLARQIDARQLEQGEQVPIMGGNGNTVGALTITE